MTNNMLKKYLILGLFLLNLNVYSYNFDNKVLCKGLGAVSCYVLAHYVWKYYDLQNSKNTILNESEAFKEIDEAFFKKADEVFNEAHKTFLDYINFLKRHFDFQNLAPLKQLKYLTLSEECKLEFFNMRQSFTCLSDLSKNIEKLKYYRTALCNLKSKTKASSIYNEYVELHESMDQLIFNLEFGSLFYDSFNFCIKIKKETDVLHENGNKVFNLIYKKYINYLEILKNNPKRVDSNESLLMLFNIYNISQFSSDLLDDIAELKSYILKIDGLILNIKLVDKVNNYTNLMNLYDLKNNLINDLSYLSSLLHVNQVYFNVNNLVHKLNRDFRAELELLSLHKTDSQILENLKNIIAAKSFDILIQYPLVEYIQNLNVVIKRLENINEEDLKKYSALLNKFVNLKSSLYKIRNLIVVDIQFINQRYNFLKQEELHEKLRKEQYIIKQKNDREFQMKQDKIALDKILKEKEIEALNSKVRMEKELKNKELEILQKNLKDKQQIIKQENDREFQMKQDKIILDKRLKEKEIEALNNKALIEKELKNKELEILQKNLKKEIEIKEKELLLKEKEIKIREQNQNKINHQKKK